MTQMIELEGKDIKTDTITNPNIQEAREKAGHVKLGMGCVLITLLEMKYSGLKHEVCTKNPQKSFFVLLPEK